jgi:tetratricopeptide (TPR) repeat protein
MYAIAALFSFPFFLPFHGLMFFLCFGILLSNGKNKGGIKLDSRVTFPLGVLILTFISVFLFLNGAAEWAKNQGKINLATTLMPYRADLWYQSALQDLNDSSRENMIHQQIVSKLRLSLKRNPYDPFVWSRLARVLISQKSGNSTEIIKAFNTAIRLGPSHAPFWIDTGFYLYQIGNTKSARDHFHRAATLEPMAPLPRVGLALTYHEINNDHANRLYQTALELKKKEKTNQFYSTYADFLFSIPSSLERR